VLRNYIGLSSTFHDPAIAFVDSRGEVVFAEGLERYLQHKRAQQCVADNLYYIRELIGRHCEPGADLVVARTWSREHQKTLASLRMALTQKVLRRMLPDQLSNFFDFFMESNKHSLAMAGRNIAMATNHDFTEFMKKGSRKVAIIDRHYDHHLTHAATGCYSSPFRDAACLIVDGLGESASYGYFAYEGGEVRRVGGKLKRSLASLGLFYGFISDACGFEMIHGEEWKLMGLAPYGELDPEVYDWLRPIMSVKRGQLVPAKNYFGIISRLTQIARRKGQSAYEFRNLAYTGHLVFCEIFIELLDALYALHPHENLVVAGGCALNSAFMGKLAQKSNFKHVFVPSAPADDGNAIGAALLAYRDDHPRAALGGRTLSPYLGSELSPRKIDDLIRYGRFKSSLPAGKTVCQYTAELLAQGRIVGWVQGRAEFGPRALGNRSILADPRSEHVKDLLNARVKFREEFRPFAPSILAEFGPEYFEHYQDSPYMDKALAFHPHVRSKVPGVVHVDGTGRLQSVTRERNPRYHDLIRAFYDLTGVPILLNTSFNVMGKPIVHSVEDCLAVFLTSGIDVLVLGDHVFEKDRLVHGGADDAVTGAGQRNVAAATA
jgi:carbamoyltransferase